MALTDNWNAGYHLNNTLDDVSGNNNTLTASGALFSASSKLGSHAGILDGIDDKFSAVHSASLAITGNITIMAWVNSDTFLVESAIISKYDTSVNSAYLLSIPTTKKPRFHLYLDNAVNYYVDGTTVMVAGTWYLVVGIRNGTTMKIYVNGVYEGTATCAANNIKATGTVPLSLGWGITGNPNAHDGYLDEVNIWSRAITDGGVALNATATGEVAELHNNGAGIEVVAGGQPLNLRGALIPGMRQWQPNMLRR